MQDFSMIIDESRRVFRRQRGNEQSVELLRTLVFLQQLPVPGDHGTSDLLYIFS